MESIKELADDIYRERACCAPGGRRSSKRSRQVVNCSRASARGWPQDCAMRIRKPMRRRSRNSFGAD